MALKRRVFGVHDSLRGIESEQFTSEKLVLRNTMTTQGKAYQAIVNKAIRSMRLSTALDQ